MQRLRGITSVGGPQPTAARLPRGKSRPSQSEAPRGPNRVPATEEAGGAATTEPRREGLDLQAFCQSVPGARCSQAEHDYNAPENQLSAWTPAEEDLTA